MLTRILKSFSWAFGAQILVIISGILFSVIAARAFGPQGMGILAFYMSLLFLLNPIGQWGLTLLLQREILDDDTDNKSLLSSSLLTRLLFGGGAFMMFVCIALWLRADTAEVLKIGLPIALILLLKSFGIFNAAYQALKLWKLTFIISLVSVFALLSTSLFAVFSGWGLGSLAWSKAIEALFYSIICLCFVRFLLPSNRAEPDLIQEKRTVPYVVKMGGALAITGAVVAAYSRIDQIIIAQLMNEEALGLYAVAMQLTMGWWAVGALIVTFLRPTALVNAKSKPDLDSVTEGSFAIIVAFGLGVFLANFLFGETLVNVLYGAAFSEVSNLLLWLSPTAMFAAMGGVRTSYMIACRQDGLYLITTILGLAVAIMGNFLLIPLLGLKGAVISLNISLFVVAVPATFMFSSIRHVGWMMLKSMFLPFSKSQKKSLSRLWVDLGRL